MSHSKRGVDKGFVEVDDQTLLVFKVCGDRLQQGHFITLFGGGFFVVGSRLLLLVDVLMLLLVGVLMGCC